MESRNVSADAIEDPRQGVVDERIAIEENGAPAVVADLPQSQLFAFGGNPRQPVAMHLLPQTKLQPCTRVLLQ